MELEGMRSINKLVGYILTGITVIVTITCFVFALLFGVASISAVTQVGIPQLIVLLSFCYLFSLAGSRFLTITDLLYNKVRRFN
jgi:hypothetical protein